jgi:hypothetical protein
VAAVAAAILTLPVPPPVFTPSVRVSEAALSTRVSTDNTPRLPSMLLVGDSTAASAAQGFTDAAHGSYRVIPAGMFPTGDSYCPLDIWLDALREHIRGVHPQPPSPECDWLHSFPILVRAYDPAVVVVMFSLWDTLPHHVQGRWLETGTLEWRAEIAAAARCAIGILSSRGARVEFVLAPATIQQPGTGSQTLDSVFTDVAASDPTRVGTIDARGPVEAGASNYRWDGIHYTADGSRVLASIAAPTLTAAFAQPRLPPPWPPPPCQPPS